MAEGASVDRVIDGRYRVLRVLGEGASARTLLCRETAGEREVAVKELRVEHLADFKAVELFEREARVLASLRHHGIPEILESFEGHDQDRGRLYLVQERIAGSSLRERMGTGPRLGEADVVRLALGVLDILEYLHERTPPVYHRDIKPSNIVLRESGAPVLVDFGSVCDVWRGAAERGSTVAGTFGYMPPEQLVGQVGPGSDLYALGATLLQVITGRSPADFPFDSGRIEVPEDLGVRPSLYALLVALLQPAPRNRPRNAAAARAILLGDGTPAPTNLPALRSPAIPALSSGGVPIRVGGPRFVDAGEPPRDPKGPFADVYKNLVEPLDRTWKIESLGLRALANLAGLAMCLFSFGVVPTLYYIDLSRRRQLYAPLFRDGVLAEGRLVAVHGDPKVNIYATFTYDYQVGDGIYRGFIDYPVRLLRYITIGDRVSVLHDRNDPTKSCVVYRED